MCSIRKEDVLNNASGAKFGINAIGAIWWTTLQPMLGTLHVGQIWNQFWWHHLVVKFWTNTSGTTYNWPNLEPKKVAFSWRDNSSYRLYTLGPLCFWQCLSYVKGSWLTCMEPEWQQLDMFHCSWIMGLPSTQKPEQELKTDILSLVAFIQTQKTLVNFISIYLINAEEVNK